ncbi:MAG: box helicase protein [Thermococcaceae archaeon]|nr:box helicase protein [Thermococcaceae archaeon]
MMEIFKDLESEVVTLKEFRPKRGRYGYFEFKNPEVNKLVEEMGFKLYKHQVDALKALSFKPSGHVSARLSNKGIDK